MNYSIKAIKQSMKSFKLIQSGGIFHLSNRSKSTIPCKLYIGFYTNRVIRTSKHSNKLSIIQQRHCTSKPTDAQIIKFQVEIDRLFDEYESNDAIAISDEITECKKCTIVIERFLEPFTHKLLPTHPNIKCYVSILDEEALLLSISNLTGISTINLEQYFTSLTKNKIDEKDATQFDDSFQYNGQLLYCRVSAIASDICNWLGPCLNHFDENIPAVNFGSYRKL
eukprot:UN10557